MRQFINTVVRYVSLGLFFQTGYSQIQFNFRFHGVANTTDDLSPSWTVTSNPAHDYSLGTYQSMDLLNAPFYFTTYLFKTASSVAHIASYQKAADEQCRVAEDTLKIVFPTLTDAYYFYVLSGELCAEKGLLKITHLNTSDDQLHEVNTIAAAGFPAIEQENDASPWAVPPPSNFGKADVVMPHYISGRDGFTLARAGVKLKDNGIPLQINITRADYDFQLQQKSRTYESYDLSTQPNQSLIQWYYTPPYLAVSSQPFESKTIFTTIYSEDSKPVHTEIDLPESDEVLMYDMSLHYFNTSAFLMYNFVLNPDNTSYPFLFLLHVLSTDGALEFLGGKPSNGVSSLVTVQQDHGDIQRGGVVVIENTADAARPNLTYFYNHRQASYLLPDSPWWLLESWSDNNALVEGADGLHLVEMQKRDTLGYELGCYDVRWAHAKTTSPTTFDKPNATSTDSSNTGLMSTSRSTFFSSAVNSNSVPNYALALGLSVGFFVLIAASITACILICCKKRPYQELKEEVNYSV